MIDEAALAKLEAIAKAASWNDRVGLWFSYESFRDEEDPPNPGLEGAVLYSDYGSAPDVLVVVPEGRYRREIQEHIAAFSPETALDLIAAAREREQLRSERDDLSSALDSARQQIEAITVDRRAIIDAQGQEHWKSVRDRRRAELDTQEGMARANQEIADLRGELDRTQRKLLADGATLVAAQQESDRLREQRNQLLGKLGASNGLLGEAQRERDEARAVLADAQVRKRVAEGQKTDLEAALTSQQQATEEAMRRANRAEVMWGELRDALRELEREKSCKVEPR